MAQGPSRHEQVRGTDRRRPPFPSLAVVLAGARSEGALFDTVGAAFAEAGYAVAWWSPPSFPPGGEHGWSLPVSLCDLGPSLLLRIDDGGSPRFLLQLSGSPFSPEDLDEALLVQGQLVLAFELLRARSQLDRREVELATRNRLAESAAHSVDFTAFLRTAVNELMAFLRCDGLSLYLLDPDRPEAVLSHHVGGTAEAEQAFARVALGRGLIGRVARDGQTRCWNPEHFGPEARPVIERMGFGTGLAVAICTRSITLGVLNAAWFERRDVPASEQSMMEAMGSSFGAIIQSQTLAADLRRNLGDLARAQAQAVQHERMAAVGEMAALVAHEVRTPLAVLFNAVACLRRNPTDAQRNELMEIVMQEGERLSAMIDDLVQLAEPSIPVPQSLELGELLKAAIATVEADAELELPNALPRVWIDARLTRQVLINVLQNAVTACSGRKPIAIRVSVAEGAFARVDVRDDGAGVREEIRERIFEPFFTTRARGAGLGLALSRRVMRAQGGDISLTDPGPGSTTFTLHVPLLLR